MKSKMIKNCQEKTEAKFFMLEKNQKKKYL